MKRLALFVMLLALGGFSIGCSPAADSGGAAAGSAATGDAEAPAEGADAAGAAGGGEEEATGSSETTH